MIKVDILVNMPLDVLEKSIKTREMEGKIVNKTLTMWSQSTSVRKKFLR